MCEVILTVVIPTYNSENYLEECLDSVRRESQAGVEFILVDGASTDQTLAIVERHNTLFTHIVSESDNGQSNAFNKGFALAKGRYLTWLNSDDVLCHGAMARALPILQQAKHEWLTANSVYLDTTGQVLKCCRSGAYEAFAVRRGLLNVFGPSTFFSKRLYEELGEIDEAYHYCMDTEYWWRIASSGRRYERMGLYFWGLRLHSDAKTANVILSNQMPEEMRKEKLAIAAQYFPEVSERERYFAVKMVKLWRIWNLSYPRALWDTLRKRGKHTCRA